MKEISKLKGEMKLLEGKMIKETTNVANTCENVSNQIKNQRGETDALFLHFQTVEQGIADYNQKVLNNKTEILEKVNESEDRSLKKFDHLTKRLNKLDQESKDSENLLKQNSKSIEEMNATILAISKQAHSLDKNISNLTSSKLDYSEFTILRDHLKQDANFALIHFEKLKKKIEETDKYLNLYRPLQVFDDVIKAFDFILCHPEERKRLTEYFEPTKKVLIEKISSNQGLDDYQEMEKQYYR